MKRLRISVEGKTYEVEVELLDEGFASSAPRSAARTSSARVAAPAAAPAPAAPAPVAPAPAASGDGAGVVSPLAAVVVSADVAVGDTVTEGQTVMTLEAMKMNTIVAATHAGTVSAILVKAGDAVEEGQVLVTIA